MSILLHEEYPVSVHTWGKTLKDEKPGIKLCRRRFREHGVEYVDLTHLNSNVGDCAFRNASGEKKRIEVKTDTTNLAKKNFFMETVSVVEKEIAGWIIAGRADYLFYYFSKRDEETVEYLFDMPKLIEWFQKYRSYIGVWNEEKTVATRGSHSTRGIPVSVDFVLTYNPSLTFEEIFNA